MKTHGSALTDSTDHRLQVEALNSLYTKIANTLGPSLFGPDTTRVGNQALSEFPLQRRDNVQLYWGPYALGKVEPLLRQIEILEASLIQQEEIANCPIQPELPST